LFFFVQFVYSGSTSKYSDAGAPLRGYGHVCT